MSFSNFKELGEIKWSVTKNNSKNPTCYGIISLFG